MTLDLRQKLSSFEKALPRLLTQESQWRDEVVNVPPVIERLFLQFEGIRAYLHRLGPCAPEDKWWHPHVWPSVMKVLEGHYRMDFGKDGAGSVAVIEAVGGITYEMPTRESWHAIYPATTCWSIMIAGEYWPGVVLPPLKHGANQGRLQAGERAELFHKFRSLYPV